MTDITLLLLSILIALECFDRLKRYSVSIYNTLPSLWFANKKSSEETEPIEADDEDFFIGKYDVYAFRERMEKMKDENGLFDIPNIPEKTNFTGVEVITESSEIEKDRKVGN